MITLEWWHVLMLVASGWAMALVAVAVGKGSAQTRLPSLPERSLRDRLEQVGTLLRPGRRSAPAPQDNLQPTQEIWPDDAIGGRPR